MSKETILKISEYDAHEYEGYEIQTTEQTILVVINNTAQCCEEWGYVSTIDDTEDFIGAELLNIIIVGENLSTREFTVDEKAMAMFVNFETNRGTFQLIMYNMSNGYYGHAAVVKSNQLTIKATL